MTEGVDEGDIIVQKKCDVTADIKAYELVAVQMRLAGEAFDECYESVLMNQANRKKRLLKRVEGFINHMRSLEMDVLI